MNQIVRGTLSILAVSIALAACASLQAGPVSFQGNFASDDELRQIDFNVAVPGLVTVQTFGYAGGMNQLGNVISAGGFDPVLTLFDGAGNFLVQNNDAPCGVVQQDATTLNCFDAYISVTLAAGDYTLILSENDNLAVGPTLADSFTQVGNGNFSCPEFLGTPGAFCDASPSQRDNAWALDLITPDAAGVPEPGSSSLFLLGAALLIGVRTLLSINQRKS